MQLHSEKELGIPGFRIQGNGLARMYNAFIGGYGKPLGLICVKNWGKGLF